MARDFTKNLTIMVAGSGNATLQHVQESLAEWIFGPVEEREVHVIIPVLSGMGGGLRNLIKIGLQWEFDFTVIQAKDAPMTRDLSGLPEESFIRKDDEREALEYGLSLLTNRYKDGDEAAFFMAYNPASTYEQGSNVLSDYEIIGDAKNYQWLTTLNLCEGLIDSFEGYKSTDEILKEERLKQEFEDKQRAIEAAKPKPVKKAPAPRKRAAKKVEKEEAKPLEIEPEKPLQEPSESTNELSATVPLIIHPDIQEDINAAHAQVEKRNMIAVSKIDLAQLSTDIKELTTAFGNIMDTFTRILKDG